MKPFVLSKIPAWLSFERQCILNHQSFDAEDFFETCPGCERSKYNISLVHTMPQTSTEGDTVPSYRCEMWMACAWSTLRTLLVVKLLACFPCTNERLRYIVRAITEVCTTSPGQALVLLWEGDPRSVCSDLSEILARSLGVQDLWCRPP